MANKKKSSKRPPPKGNMPAGPAKKSTPPKKAQAPRPKSSQSSGQVKGRTSRQHRSNLGPALMIGGVVAVVVLMVFVFITGTDDEAAQAGASPGAVDKLTSIPVATLDAVGVASDPRNVNALPAGTAPVVEDGKPVVLYFGSEACPFCAVQRWPVTVALSRFGTFGSLEATTSPPSPSTLPNTPTVTYHGATYSSDYITLSSVETATRTGAALETPDDLQSRLFSTYNVESVTGSNGGIPFMMVGNLYTWAGSQYDPGVLDDKTFDEIVDALADPVTDVALEIGTTANYLTAMICQLTGGEPADVCTSAGVQAAQTVFPPV
ncbi:MAG: DUF929 domain-containing protein [Acidimicrobiia bacterium]|nr:DUF929 domain-containing protein [Acidimicrobiia bacterium]